MGATFTAYPDLNTPNEVIEKMRDFVSSKGYSIVQDLTDDLDVFDQSISDGKKFTFLDKSGNYFVNLRSQNGINIFGVNDEVTQSAADKTFNTDKRLSGVGMTVSESYSDETRWYNQYNVPLKFASNPDTIRDVLGVYMPVPTGTEDIEPVEEPDEVPEPEPIDEPEYPDLPTPPTPPTSPTPPTEPYLPTPSAPPEPVISKFVPDNASIRELYKINHPEATDAEIDALSFSAVYNGGPQSYGNIPTSQQFSGMLAGTSNFGYLHYNNTPLTYNGETYVAIPISPQGTGNLTMKQLYALSTIPSGSNKESRIFDDRVYWPSSSNIDYLNPRTESVSGITYYSVVFNNSSIGVSSTGMYNRGYGGYPQYAGICYLLKKSDFDAIYNRKSEYEAWQNKTSQAWTDYYNQLAILQQQYQEELDAYDVAYQNYLDLKADYDAEVADILATYQALLDAYNAYLQAQALYDQYLALLAEYNAYLQELEDAKNKYTLFCNEVTDPTDEYISTLTFSLLKTNDSYYQVSHLIVGNLIKYDKWTGGIIFSGSANRYNMIPANYLYKHDKTSDRVIFPVLSSGKESNTFLRINIDNAPQSTRGQILWASSGQDNITGKPLSLPMRTGNGVVVNKTIGTTLSKEDGSTWNISTGDGNTEYGNGEVPHYYFMQSHQRLDSGRNVNTLNCITINMPIFAAVLVDPDELNNYAAAGEVLGVYFVSMYNIQTSSVYEINYPSSNDTCQAFSVGKRRGVYGFDGISIKQMDTAIGAGDTPSGGSSGSGGDSGNSGSGDSDDNEGGDNIDNDDITSDVNTDNNDSDMGD